MGEGRGFDVWGLWDGVYGMGYKVWDLRDGVWGMRFGTEGKLIHGE